MDHSLGWVKDTPDSRDYKLMSRAGQVELPRSYDLTANFAMPPIDDQLSIGSCVPHNVWFAIGFLQLRTDYKWKFHGSMLFLYYTARELEGTLKEDSGVQIRNGIKAAQRWGVPPDYFWPYHVEKFKDKPSDQAYKSAEQHQITSYVKVPQRAEDLKAVLVIEKLPIIFGFEVFTNIRDKECREKGVLKLPKRKHESLGGHCVSIVGYNDKHPKLGRAFKIRNSWGSGFGLDGYFWMPEEYILDRQLACDFTAISNSEELTWPVNK